MRRIALPFAMFAMIAAAAAAAQPPAFSDVDIDGDELLSLIEVQSADEDWTEEEFEAADEDDNEFLTEQEYEAGLKARKQ